MFFREIFKDEVGEDTVFKEGTSLSKCYQMIDRFSEDIDLVVMRRENETDNKLKNKLKKIGKIVSETLPEEEIYGLNHKVGISRKTAHFFEIIFEEDFG